MKLFHKRRAPRQIRCNANVNIINSQNHSDALSKTNGGKYSQYQPNIFEM